ncbi:NotI family restriction endonuclease [Burkholderia glumae]|uniref:Restriction endonuclease type II NotI domain-containing protein n=1 Tax=Burkholderia glumae TaxID=337 RepID=A0AAQ0BPW2_BURGL|nr:NotI family restriction endonuclease [Burkholderia glumae]ACR31953.1 Hypothetical protein bglu_2g16110 [Burkholderia glumae BGR1]AJY62850.1 restriction endonuclease NotI family protein [Burkholderia glumae LMG 2196 = ATCC 33617]KHJ59829.1 hypothetical protein NCPPB3923_27285 [Burkholderia glumae]NVE24389.1 hypothetical protein [Burkholderia glumae]PNL05782.1 hypothetical protein CEQ24_007835 [Burkholderia glumae]
MSKVVELFGKAVDAPGIEWQKTIAEQGCPFLAKRCYKIRKSNPEISIGSCTVLYGRPLEPIIICPTRLIERGQIFVDCLHLLTCHEPGNELHLVSEVSVPGGSIDYVLVSTKDGKIRDFVGIELQTLDTTGTVWPERQRLLKELGVARNDNDEESTKPFGMNWKMTAKTILVQMHHKVQTFEHVNRKLVLVVQDKFLAYMTGEFKFDHVKNPAAIGDSLHLHSYRMARAEDGNFRLSMASRFSTDAEGIAACLGLQAEARIELEQIIATLQAKISPATLFRPV